MLIQWNNDQTLGKSEHAYYRLSQRYCPEPGIEERRWFAVYQAGAQVYDPNGIFTTVKDPVGFKTKEEAIAACEENAKFDKDYL
jgi:hypothetical protein